MVSTQVESIIFIFIYLLYFSQHGVQVHFLNLKRKKEEVEFLNFLRKISSAPSLKG